MIRDKSGGPYGASLKPILLLTTNRKLLTKLLIIQEDFLIAESGKFIFET